MRPGFTFAAILAAVTLASDAEFGRYSRGPQSFRPQRRAHYPTRAPPRSYGTSARPQPLTNRSPAPRTSGYASTPRPTLRQAQSIPGTKTSPRSRHQTYGPRSERDSRPTYGSRPERESRSVPAKRGRSPLKRERTSRSYASGPRPQPEKTPNYDSKKLDLHKLAEQVEINTLRNQSLQMKVGELQSMVIELQEESAMQQEAGAM